MRPKAGPAFTLARDSRHGDRSSYVTAGTQAVARSGERIALAEVS